MRLSKGNPGPPDRRSQRARNRSAPNETLVRSPGAQSSSNSSHCAGKPATRGLVQWRADASTGTDDRVQQANTVYLALVTGLFLGCAPDESNTCRDLQEYEEYFCEPTDEILAEAEAKQQQQNPNNNPPPPTGGAGGQVADPPPADNPPMMMQAPIGNIPEPAPAGHEFRPAALSAQDAAQAYANFVQDHVEDCGGSKRVVSDQLDSTVSEGIAYGMMLSVAHDDQATFDGLWQYYQNNTNDVGVMHWKRRGCEGTPVYDHGAADAELDAAMALIQADCKWGGYEADATYLLDVIRDFETATANGLRMLKPGDRFGGRECLNPGYFAPGYYRAFARYQPARAEFWEDLREDTYTLYDRMANASTGLVPDWSDDTGLAGPPCAMEIQATDATGAFGSNFAYDAARAPWRMATDYVWWQETRSKALLTKMVETMNGNGGPSELGDTYALTGERLADNKTSVFSGTFTLAAMAHSQAAADEYGQVFLAEGHEVKYFDSALRAVYMLLATGLFSPGCAK